MYPEPKVIRRRWWCVLGVTLAFMAKQPICGQVLEALPTADPVAAGFDATEQSQRVDSLPSKEKRFPKNKPAGKMPANFAPSWITGQRANISGVGFGRVVSIENLYARALTHSDQIRVFSDLP